MTLIRLESLRPVSYTRGHVVHFRQASVPCIFHTREHVFHVQPEIAPVFHTSWHVYMYPMVLHVNNNVN